MGAVTNLSIYSLLIFLNFNYNIAATLAFCVAVSQNYLLNKQWTFKEHETESRKKFLKYLTLNFLSFLMNLFVLNLVIMAFGSSKTVQISAQVVGLVCAMGFNFAGSYLYVFKKRKT